LATGVMFGKLGHEVVCVDVDPRRVRSVNSGKSPFYEPPLERELSKLVRGGRLRATDDVLGSVRDSRFVFICVQTPSLSTGRIDIRALKSACKSVAKVLRRSEDYKVVVVKSTVVPSTTDTTVRQLLELGSGRTAGVDFGLCMNPEFLQEGSALKDSMEPTRIVVGAIDKRCGSALAKLYSPIKSDKIMTDLRTAEMIKYASNAFLATKISYANEIANICYRLGIDSEEVLKAAGKDPRIGPLFLKPGLGFGGSCLPKDVKALRQKARALQYPSRLLNAVLAVNDEQPYEASFMLKDILGTLDGKKIAVLGLSFKGGVDDVRETRAAPLIAGLLASGAEVVAYDPMATSNFIELMPTIAYASSAAEALRGADACIIQADWPQFKKLGRKEYSKMRTPVVVDGRRFLVPGNVEKAGARYYGVGYGLASKD
jgi:UDPglucose 6-dehydrogenase